MKKFLSVLFVVLMSLPAMAKTAAMMQEEVAGGDGSCGEKVTWDYDAASKTLTISGEGDMTNYETPDDLPWVTYMPYITTIVIGKEISSLSDYAFYWCSALVSVIVEAPYPPFCGSFAFYNMGPDATLTVPANRKTYYAEAFGWKKFGDNIQEEAPETSGSCGENATWAYDSATKTLTIMGTGRMMNYREAGDVPWATIYASVIEKVYISDGITSICDHAFDYHSSLVSVRLPNSLESMGRSAFDTCRMLKSIVIPQNVTSIGDFAFYGCTNLESITLLPVFPPALGKDAFDKISRDAKFTVPEESLTLYQKAGNWHLYLPSSYCGENATWAYDAATGTLSVTGTGEMFNYHGTTPWKAHSKDIRKIVIGEGITHIGDLAFYFCDALSSVTMPSTLKIVGEESFAYCKTLASVTIPANVTEIKMSAFESCSALATVTVEAVKPPVISDDVFDEIAPDAQFIVPVGSEAAYRADENWKELFKETTEISSIEAAKGNAKVKKVFRNGKIYIGDYTIAGLRAR